MHKHTYIPTLVSLLTACQLDPKDLGTPDSAGDATMSSGAADTTAEADTTAADDTGIDPATTADTGIDPATTAATDESAGTLDTDGSAGDTDVNDTEETFPAECDEQDPTVDATFSLEIPGWPDDPNTLGVAYDVQCTIDAVDTPGTTVTTALTCDVEGASRSATLALTAAPEGPAVWQPGDLVRLIYHESFDAGFAEIRALELRRDDDALLVSANDSVIDELFEQRFAPLTVDLLFDCGAPGGVVPLRVNFTPVAGETVSIFDGHRGLLPLPLDTDEGFAIDVARARGDDFHTEGELEVLLRRVDLTP